MLKVSHALQLFEAQILGLKLSNLFSDFFPHARVSSEAEDDVAYRNGRCVSSSKEQIE
jgi:hypothetical protein